MRIRPRSRPGLTRPRGPALPVRRGGPSPSDSTGQYLVAVANAQDIWTSTDYGVSWSNVTSGTGASGKYWLSVASDSTGAYLVAVANDGYIWTSNNGTQSDYNISGEWDAVASDSTGQYLAAAAYGADIWTSSNYGKNGSWTDVTSGTSAHGQYWSALASDSTGTHLVAAGYNLWTGVYSGSALDLDQTEHAEPAVDLRRVGLDGAIPRRSLGRRGHLHLDQLRRHLDQSDHRDKRVRTTSGSPSPRMHPAPTSWRPTSAMSGPRTTLA